MAMQLLKSNGGPLFAMLSIFILGALFAIFFGLLAGTGNFVFVIVGAGLVGGIFMISQPAMLLWLGLLWTLLFSGLIYYFTGISKVEWLIYATGGGFWGVAILQYYKHTIAIENKIQSPYFLKLLWVFFTISILSSLIQWGGVVQFVVGIKNYLMFFGFALVLYYAVYSAITIRRVAIGLLLIGIVQLPVTIYQYVFVRGHRLATGGRRLFDSEVEASDSVVGTMGGKMYGGGHDDVLAMLICVILAGIFAAYKYKKITGIKALMLSALVLIPVLLSETKIIFVYIPVFLTIIAWETIRKNPVGFVGFIFAVPIFVFSGLLLYYEMHWSSEYKTFQESIEKSFAYSFNEHAGKYRAELGEMSRRESIEYWWNSHGLNRADLLLFGHGLASSKASSTVLVTETVKEQGGLRLDKTGLSELLWDTGVVGTSLFILALLLASIEAGRLSNSNNIEGMDTVILKASQAGIVLALISLPYKNSLLQSAGLGYLLFLMIGLVAFFSRQNQIDVKQNN